MSNIDAKVADHFSKILHEKLENGESISENDFDNFITSLSFCLKDKTPLGSETENFAAFLHAKYCYDNVGEFPGFDLGALYGLLKFLNKVQEIKELRN